MKAIPPGLSVLKRTWLICVVVSVLIAGCEGPKAIPSTGNRMIDQLITDSSRKYTLLESEEFSRSQAIADDAMLAKNYVIAHNDYSSYHLLMALREHAPDTYDEIPNETKAAILSSALRELIFLNDFGRLDPQEGYDGPTAKALLNTGQIAVSFLEGTLDDKKDAPLLGSEASALSRLYSFRRCDFALRYVSLLLGHSPSFSPIIGQRDQQIVTLKQHLASKRNPRN
jgi:hypothetical protein